MKLRQMKIISGYCLDGKNESSTHKKFASHVS